MNISEIEAGTNTVNSHYPDYNVMNDIDEWDSHTKEIVKKRLGPFEGFRFLTDKEADYLAIIVEHLTYDSRREIIQWVLWQMDQKLQEEIGEGERKVNTPPEADLVRRGLQALDHVAHLAYARGFSALGHQQQFELLAAMQKGQAPQIPEWSLIPQKELFKKLVGVVTGAYYSHPLIWSEIGYGGPVYPKSYVRIEFGLTDPWEAKQNGK